VITLVGNTAEEEEPSGDCKTAVGAPPHSGRSPEFCMVTASGKNASSSTAAAGVQRLLPTVKERVSLEVEVGSLSTSGGERCARVVVASVHAVRTALVMTVQRASLRVPVRQQKRPAPLPLLVAHARTKDLRKE
jgi:hypothetical protein